MRPEAGKPRARRVATLVLGVAAVGVLGVCAAALVWVRGGRATPSDETASSRSATEPRFAAIPNVTTRAEPVTLDAGAAADETAPDEATLMNRLRRIEDSDPTLALELAREGDARFPGSANSAERAMIVVKSLARQGSLSEARGKAEVMVNEYAGTRWALEVEQHTGAHPHRSR